MMNNGLGLIDGLLERFGLSEPSRVGYAFSGGGSKGFTHIGALMALEQFGVKPDVMSGVSAGSIAAVLYGAGLSPREIMKCFEESSRFGDFTEWNIPRTGFLKLNRFGKLLESWLPVCNLEDLKIPTVICATDLDRGCSVGWSKGEIVPRVLASCSIPIIFNPQKINGVHYVDGGVLRNLPAWAIRKYCKTLYGLNCSPIRRDYSYRASLIDIMLRTYNLMSKANTLQDLNLCDVVIQQEDSEKFGTFDLKSLQYAVMAGYDTACRVLEKISNIKN
ncbi:MAG: patatin-like phospholipase family protein [Muribaculaceae bacterium]|nr:patatin-like phospholipase family protein [Muribaculaceae bacterium]